MRNIDRTLQLNLPDTFFRQMMNLAEVVDKLLYMTACCLDEMQLRDQFLKVQGDTSYQQI